MQPGFKDPLGPGCIAINRTNGRTSPKMEPMASPINGAHERPWPADQIERRALADLMPYGRESRQRITLFYARRAALHWRQQRAQALGARLEFVAPGYMSNVQAKARAY